MVDGLGLGHLADWEEGGLGCKLSAFIAASTPAPTSPRQDICPCFWVNPATGDDV